MCTIKMTKKINNKWNTGMRPGDIDFQHQESGE